MSHETHPDPMVTVENKLQIRSHSIISYKRFTGYTFRTDSQRQSADLLKERKTYSGKMCPGSKKRLIKAIENLVSTTNEKRTFILNPLTGKQMPFQLAFTTLTIHNPDRNVSQKEAYKNLLAPFLQWLRRSHNTYLYIWKAELQERGQLHYHLLLGNYVPHTEIRRKWNDLQKRGGYLDAYYNEKGHFDAPSTEIKNTIEREDIAGYLIKEISKSLQNVDTVGGKVWDCSMNLKEIGYYEVNADKYAGVLQHLTNAGNMRVAFEGDSCRVYKMNDYKPANMLDRIDSYLYKDHLEFIKSTELSAKSRVTISKPPPKLFEIRKVVEIEINGNLFSSS